MQIQYLHEKSKPILPAVGDIRVLPVLQYNHDPSAEAPKVPTGKIRIARCCKLLEHHAVYEFLGEDKEKAEAVPFELIEKYGYLTIDDGIKWILNSFMSDIIESSKTESRSFLGNTSEYYLKLEHLVKLSRQVLKEAEKAKSVYEKTLTERK